MADDVQKITGTKAAVAARLCNFRTGTSALLPAHTAWLVSAVKPIVAGNPAAWVDLIGHASFQWKQTGGANAHALNKALSADRCAAIKRQVAGFNPAARFNVVVAEGDAGANTQNKDDGYDRAVEVYVYQNGPPPVPPKPPGDSPVVADKFEIRVVGGGSVSAGIQADNFVFQIVDLNRKRTAFYLYTAIGATIPVPGLPGSVTKKGPPSKFSTTRHTELHQFNSKASLSQDPGATLGDWSVGGTMRLTISNIQDFDGLISTRPGMIPIEGGWGIQSPGLGSLTHGVLALTGGVMDFTGY